jgi:predicted nucleotidyltransferase
MVRPAPQPVSLDRLGSVVHDVCEPRGVARVEVFGSLASGSFGPDSDVDLLVEFLPDVRAGLFEMGEVKELLEEELGVPVDLLSRRAVENCRNPYHRVAILANPATLHVR